MIEIENDENQKMLHAKVRLHMDECVKVREKTRE